ncbi:Phosphatidylinositol phosphatase PTPRQ-like [Oopsacas minuta]|uniref:Phosphatidylinositol phosphatase PTPRQ-like n=1 Tax=Oopsacas minuta TaxID=111878 RepID=A0AAV7KJL5_9METZ|nr:Phosphatidylinositol phosphatase PTPRQ-like [Oopsacas minuta]
MAFHIFAIISLLLLLTKGSIGQTTCDVSANGTCYLFVKESADWQTSEDYCETWGGHLVSIHNDEELDVVSTLTNGYYIWIGMTDSATESVWEWVDGSNNAYNQFTRDPPYDYYGNQDCAIMYSYSYDYYYSYYYYYMRSYTYLYWDDSYCHYTRYSVCSQVVPMPSEPRSLEVANATSTSLTIKWEAPLEHNDSLTQYSVKYYGQELDTEEREIVITQSLLENQVFTIYDLEEANEYTISVAASTAGGAGSALTIMNQMTLEDVPSLAPTIEGAYSSVATEIELTWNPPELEYRNGIITQYTISYEGRTRDTNLREITRDATLPRMLTLTNLEEYNQYKIEITANTAVGAGPAAASFVRTAADAPSAPVTNHTVSPLTSTELFVSWNPPALEDRNGVLSYKISHKGPSASTYTTIGVTTMLTFSVTGLEEAYTYDIQVTPVSVGLDGPESVVSGTTLEDVPHMSARNIILSNSAYNMLTVTWDPPSSENQNGVIIEYVIIFFGVGLDEQERMATLSTSVPNFVTSYTATNLEADTSYTFSIIAYTSIGSGPAMTVTGFTTDITAPSSSPNDVTVTATSSTSLHVTWSEVDLIDRNGPISSYTVYYTGLRLQPETKSITVLSTVYEAMIESLEENSEYSVTVSASTSAGEGPKNQAVTETTFSDIPSASVSNLNATAQSAGSILVEFDELAYADRNGDLAGYQIMYWRNADDSRIHTKLVQSAAETGRVSVLIRSLMPYTSYRIEVAATTVIGTGQVSMIPSVYTHEDIPIIEISSTTGSATGPHTASLFWNKPNCANETQIANTLYNITYRYTDHLQIEHTDSIVTSNNFMPVESLLPYTEYTFDVTTFTGAGVGSVGPREVIRTNPKAPSMSASQVILEAINSTSIRVTCHPPALDHQNGLLHSYAIFYTGNLFDTNMREVVFELSGVTFPENKSREFVITDLMEYEEYSIMVRVSTSAGYSQYTDADMVRTAEGAPTEAPQDVMSAISNSTCIQIEWSPPPVTSQRGAITSYTIKYQGVERDTSVQTEMVPVTPNFPDMSHQSHLVCDLMEDTTYKVNILCENSAGASRYSLGVNFKTEEAAPTEAPSNLAVTSHTPQISTLTWTAPASEHQNGIITYYNILLSEGGNSPSLIMAPSLSFDLKPLKAHTSYTVTVAAVTSAGSGPFASFTFMTPQDVPTHGVSSLMLTSRTATTLSLSWMAPLLSQRRGVLLHYKLSYYGFQIDTSLHTIIVELGDVDAVTQYTIEGLEEATNYTVEVMVVGQIGDGPVARLTHLCTLPIAPTGAVIDLELVSVTSRYSIISWMPPLPSEHNGPLGDYKITVTSSSGNVMYTSTQTSYRIEDLMEHTMYTVSVVSSNMEGDGPEATLSFTTLKNVPSGAPTNFTVSNIDTNSLLAHWSPPAPEDRNGDLTEYLLLYMGEMMDTSMRSVRIMVADGEEELDQSYLLEGLEEYTSYTLVLSVLNDKGESPVVRLQNVQTLPIAPSSAVSGLKIDTLSSTDALISWTSPEVSTINGAGFHYKIYLSAGTLDRTRRDSEGTVMTTEGHHVMLKDLSPATSYSLSVEPSNDQGNGPSSMLDINTMEDVPSAPVQNVTLTSITATSLSVSWTAPPVADQNGAILLYTVQVSAVNSAYIQSVTSQELIAEITGLHADTLYTVVVTPETSMGSGVDSTPIEFITMESVPAASVNDFSIIQLNSTAVLITWTPLASNMMNGDITHYFLSYTSHKLESTFTLTTEQFFIYIYTLNATDGYTFSLTAYNSMGAGPEVIETISYTPTPEPAFQFTDKEMSYTFSGVLILVVLLMLILIFSCAVVICFKKRSSKNIKRANVNLELESCTNPRSRGNSVYSVMQSVSVKEKQVPTYDNFRKESQVLDTKRQSLLKSPELIEGAPPTPKNNDTIYVLQEQMAISDKEAETYGNPIVLEEPDNSP